MKIDDLKPTEVIEIVENEPVLEIITEQEQRAEKAYKGMINNALVGVGK
ncbi:TPA: hypothetical protein VJS59_001626 [Streptococcus pyogenes]|nr:hypothetical protein [Streptococcus pyogenes]